MPSPKRQQQRTLREARLEAQRRAQKKSANIKRVRNVGIFVVVIAIAVVLFANVFSSSSSTSSSTTVPTSSTASTTAAPLIDYGTGNCPPVSGVDTPVLTFKEAPPKCITDNATYTATFDTSEGKIVVALDPKRSPIGVNNFVFLARNKYYDGTKIFRTDPSIDIIQGGSPHTNDNTDTGPGYALKDDPTGFKYTAGDLVYANSGGANTSGGQFFFGTGPNVSNLDAQGTYITIGHASTGLDVLKTILGLNTGTGTLGGKPSRDVVVKTVTIEEKPA